MRRRGIAIAAAAALLLVAGIVLVLPFVVDLNRYRGRVEAALRQQLGRDVTLGHLELSVVPPGVDVERAVIGEDPAFQTGRPFAQLRRISVRPKLLPLLRGVFEINTLELDAPEVELVRGSGGQWNVATLGGQSKSQSGDSALVLNHFVMTGGQIALTDLRPARGSTPASAPERSVYKNIDAQLDGFAPGRAFDLVLGITFPGSGTGRLAVQGTAGPIDRQAAAMTPFEGTVQLDQVSLASVMQFLDSASLDGTDATLSGSASLRNMGGMMSSNGAVQASDAKVRGVAIGYPIALGFNVAHNAQDERLTIAESTLTLDKTPVTLTGAVNLQPDTPVLDVHVTAAGASLSEAARLASAFGVAFGAKTKVQGRADLDVRAKGPADTPALDGTLRLRDVSISGDGIAQPVRAAAIDVTMTPDLIRTNDFMVTTAGTSVGARAALSGYTTPKRTLDARVRASGDLGELLNVARAWGAGVDGMSGSGRAALDAGATGPLDALTFNGSGSLTDATLQTPALTQPLRIRTVALSFNRDAAVLEKLAAGLGKSNFDGRLSVRSFASPRVDFQLAADRIDVRELQSMLPPPSAAPASPSGKKASGPSDSVFTRTTGTGRLRVGSIVYQQIVLDDVDATVTLDRGMVHLNPLTAGLFGGRHRGSIDVDARRTPATLSVASTLEKVDANRLTSAVTSVKDVLFGALGSTVRMTLSGDSPATMARSLNGTMALTLTDGQLANLSLRKEIANIARFVSGEPASARTTSVARLMGTFAVKDGVARTDDLTAAIEDGTLGASGTVDLADQTVNMRLMTVLSKEATQKAGGSRVGGFLTTALANQQGELVVPLLVTGTMSSPRVAPDVQRVGEMKVKSLVPSLRDPRGLTSGILGALGGAKSDPGAQKDAPPPGDAPKEAPKDGQKDTVKDVEDALRDLFRRRTPENKPAEPAPPAK